MELKNLYGAYNKIKTGLTANVIDKIWIIAFSFIGSLLCTRGLAFGKYAPFAVAFTASVPKSATWAAVAGGIIGYLLPTAAYMPARYIVALVAVALIKWALSELKKINSHVFFAPVISFLPLVLTGISVVLINNSLPSVAVMYLAESFLASGVAFFFTRAVQIVYRQKGKGVFDNTDIACLAVSFAVLVLSFKQLEIYDVSLGRVFMILTILICANAGGIAGGAISGVAIGAISGLSSIGLSYMSGAYGLGGLMAGVFSSLGKVCGIVAFIIAHGIASMQVGADSNMLASSIEVAIATVAFMFIPKNQTISNIFAMKKGSASGEALKSNIVLRIKHAASALGEISGCVDTISQKLAKSEKAKIGQVYNQAAGEICAGCSMRTICWNKDRKSSVESFASLSPILKGKGKIETEDFKNPLKDRCGRIGDMREAVNKNYKTFLAKQSAEIRAAQVRDITKEQFQITSTMLQDMASEFSMYQSFDQEAKERIESVFNLMNIYPFDLCCRADSFGRLTVEAEIPKKSLATLNKSKLTREVSKACGRSFSLPCISKAQSTCKIIMSQKALLDVKIGVSQSSADTLCGDSHIGFYDGQGRFVALLSDGMGTGGMAAVDGTMACSMMESLLKAGIGYTSSLRLINSALMAKCQDETLATMDIASLDLFTGKCQFRKAGATGTIYRKAKKFSYLEKESVPVGIMQEVKYAFFEESFKRGDIIVLLSDGATSCGTDWIGETVENFVGDDPETLSKEIVSYAKRTRSDGHQDDITAFVIMITGSEEVIVQN